MPDYDPRAEYPDANFPIKAQMNPSIVTYPSGKTYACAGSVIVRVPTGTTRETMGEWIVYEQPVLNIERVRIAGSKGNTYTVTRDLTRDDIYCSCPGYKFRGNCKHLTRAFPS